MLVIGVTGFRGSGKSLAADAACALKIPVLEMSAPVVSLMRKRGLKVTNRNLRLFADRIRNEKGKAVSARLAIAEIRKMRFKVGKKPIVVNGVRSVEEIREFRKHFDFQLIALRAPVRMRFKRILKRGRKDDPKKYSDFIWSERMERKWGLARAFTSANYVVRNTGTRAETLLKLKRFLRQLCN